MGEGDEEFIVVAFVEVFSEISENGNLRKDLNYFGGGDQLRSELGASARYMRSFK